MKIDKVRIIATKRTSRKETAYFKPFSAMIIILAMLLVVPICSATDWLSLDNTKVYDSELNKITITDENLIFADKTLVEYTLISNTDQCLINCEARVKENLIYEDYLLSDLKVYDTNDKEVSIKELDISYVVEEEYYVDVPVYEEVCKDVLNKNTSKIENVCNNEEVNTTKELRTRTTEVPYDYSIKEAGEYDLIIRGKKGIGEKVDWRIEAFGIELTEWAWWENGFNYKKEISNLTGKIALLNVSINANMNQSGSDLRFLNSAEDTELNHYCYGLVEGVSTWCRVDNRGEDTIYMYYGNSSVSSTSSITDLYGPDIKDAWFFDDMNTTSVYDHVTQNYNSVVLGTISKVKGDVGFAMNSSADGAIRVIGGYGNATTTTLSSIFRYKQEGGVREDESPVDVGPADDGRRWIFRMGYQAGTEGLMESVHAINTIQNASLNTRDGAWHEVGVSMKSGNTGYLYHNGAVTASSASGTIAGLWTDPFKIGVASGETNFFKGLIDEVLVWETDLSSTNFSYYYNTSDYDVAVFGAEQQHAELTVTTTLNNPVDATETSNPLTYIAGNVSVRFGNYTNMTFIVYNSSDDIINQTTVNISGLTNGVCTQNGVADESCGTTGSLTSTDGTYTYYNFTTPYSWDNATSYIDNAGTEYWLQNCTSNNIVKVRSGDVPITGKTTECWDGSSWVAKYSDLFDGNVYWNITDIGASMLYTLQEDGVYEFNGLGCAENSTDTLCDMDTNKTVTLDSTAPVINITKPILESYHILNTNLSFNWSISDAGVGLDSCWYSLNNGATNVSLTCGDLNASFNTTSFITSVKMYANDTLNNAGSFTRNFNYSVFQWAEYYNPSTIEGSTEMFQLNITNVQQLSQVDLVYNNTDYSTILNPLTSGAYYNYSLEKSLAIPQASDLLNNTFYWKLLLADGTQINTTLHNQSVSSISFDNCTDVLTNNTVNIFDFFHKDEDTQEFLTTGSDIKVDLIVYPSSSTTQILNYSKASTLNITSVCMNINLTTQVYNIDGVVSYSAPSKFTEFYHFQNYTLSNDTVAKDINLFDLNSSKGQAFKITYKDENFVAVTDALIDIQRKYLDEGVFKTVEQPKTSIEGFTTGHFIVDDVIYNLIIKKNGNILATFSDIIALCQTPALSDCEINLNSYGSATIPEDFSTSGGVSFNIDYDPDTKIITTTFTTTSGVPETVSLNTTLYDALGNTTVCSDQLYSSGGTLTCTVPSSFGNTTVVSKVYSDGDLIGQSVIRATQTPSDIYGTNLILIAMVFFLVFVGIGASSDSPMFMGLMMAFGSIILVSLNIIYSPSLVGAGATILWFVVLVAVLLIKGGNRT